MSTEEPSNTGSQTPMGESKQPIGRVLGFVHYISCTFPCGSLSCGSLSCGPLSCRSLSCESFPGEMMIEELKDFLGGEWSFADNRRNGYTKRLCCGGMSLSFQGRRDMGVHLEITGDGCQDLEGRTREKGWRFFLEELIEKKAKFSRLDVAIDDHAGLLSLRKIKKCCLAQLVVSRFSDADPKNPIKLKTGRENLTGCVFGKGGSRTMLRIYDKALEQGKEGHHVRVELQTRSARANSLARRIVEEGEQVIAGVIANTVDFKVQGNDASEHKYRWKTQPWWTKFLGEAKKIRLSTAPGERSLEKSMKALAHQYGMTMARIEDAYGSEKLLAIAAEGRTRLKNRRFTVRKPREPRRDAC